MNETILHANLDKTQIKNDLFEENVCVCGKKYKYNSGLLKHKKTCIIPPVVVQVVKEELTQNSDLYLIMWVKKMVYLLVDLRDVQVPIN